jgi:hypothetical protein
MTLEPLSPQMQAWLDSDRQAPPVDDALAQRLRARVFATVGLGAAAGAVTAATHAAPSPMALATAPVPPPAGVLGALAGLTKPAVLAVGLVTGGVVGGGAGAFWGTTRASTAARPVAVVVAPGAPAREAPAEGLAVIDTVPATAPAPAAPSTPDVPVPAPATTARPARASAAPAPPPATAAADASTAAPDPDLALLAQARTALARGAVAEARRALVTHRASFGDSPHKETRDALDVLVLWASASPDADAATARFFQAWPGSAFGGAIRRAAESGGTTDRSSAAPPIKGH